MGNSGSNGNLNGLQGMEGQMRGWQANEADRAGSEIHNLEYVVYLRNRLEVGKDVKNERKSKRENGDRGGFRMRG